MRKVANVIAFFSTVLLAFCLPTFIERNDAWWLIITTVFILMNLHTIVTNTKEY